MHNLHNLITSAIFASFLFTALAAPSAIAIPAKNSYTYTLPPKDCSDPAQGAILDTLPYEFSIEVKPLLNKPLGNDFPFRAGNPLKVDQGYTPYSGVFFDRPIITYADTVRSVFQLKDKELRNSNDDAVLLLSYALSNKWTFDGLRALLWNPALFDFEADAYPTPLNFTAVEDCEGGDDDDGGKGLELRVENGDEGEGVFSSSPTPLALNQFPREKEKLKGTWSRICPIFFFPIIIDSTNDLSYVHTGQLDFVVFGKDTAYEVFVKNSTFTRKYSTLHTYQQLLSIKNY